MKTATDHGRELGLSRWQTMILGISIACSLSIAACDAKSPTSPPAPENRAPTASFQSNCVNLVCGFDGSASSDPDGTIASYSWQFGDGGSGTGATPSRTYAAAGTYEVRLTVTDNGGATHTATRVITVSAAANQPPTASFTAVCTNLDCSFDGSGSTDADGSVASYAWNFGDSGAGAGRTVSYSYGGAGTFTVTLTVTDNGGATGTATKMVTASAAASSITQLGNTIPGLTNNEQMGRSVAMSDSGNRILVGAPLSSAGGALSGQVRAFEWNGSAWVQLGQSIDGFETSLLLGDDKGITMSGDGQRIALGTPRSGPGSRGSVIVYQLTGSTWTQVGQEIIPVASSQFGTAVSLSTNGSRLAVGGPFGGGRAEVYELVGSTWTQMGASIVGGGSDRVGFDVSLSGAGTRLMLSAQGATVGTSSGKLRVYDWNGSAWTQVGGDIDGHDGFGLNASMSRDGRRVVGYAALSGDYAAVFQLVGSNWVQMGSDFSIPGAFDIYQNVDLSASGDRLVLGSITGGPPGQNQGAVSIYDWTGSSWSQVGMAVVGDHGSAQLGWSVAMSADGSRFVAGERLYNDNVPGSQRGGAKVFTVN